MRTLRSFLAIGVCAILFLVACKKNKENTPPKINKVQLWAGQDTTVAIGLLTGANTMNASYTAVSGSEQIASVTVQGANLLIHTSIPGSTTIHITGPGNRTIDLKMEAISVVGVWRGEFSRTGERATVEVVCPDAALSAALKDQLADNDVQPQTAGLIFEDTPAVRFQELKANNPVSEGSFTFRDLTLTLTKDNITEVYRLIPRGLKSFNLEQDLTTQYQALYPDKNITRVVRTRYFRYATWPG